MSTKEPNQNVVSLFSEDEGYPTPSEVAEAVEAWASRPLDVKLKSAANRLVQLMDLDAPPLMILNEMRLISKHTLRHYGLHEVADNLPQFEAAMFAEQVEHAGVVVPIHPKRDGSSPEIGQ